MAGRRWWLRVDGVPDSTLASQQRRTERSKRPLHANEVRWYRVALAAFVVLLVVGVLVDLLGTPNVVQFFGPVFLLVVASMLALKTPSVHRRQIVGLRAKTANGDLGQAEDGDRP